MTKKFISLACLLFWCGNALAIELRASWYSEASLIKEGTWKHGKRSLMANGKEFDEQALTCASGKEYPLGTRLRVTYKAKSVVVVVTDRIARRFYGKRIDLSRGAFGKLAPHKLGVISVSVEVIK